VNSRRNVNRIIDKGEKGLTVSDFLDDELVAGFLGPPNLPESRCKAGFSASVPGSGKIQFSGGLEWLEAAMGRRFPRNWVSDLKHLLISDIAWH
jgi:hypothetical protein